MVLATDKLNQRVYITSIVAKKSASKLFATLPTTRSKIQGAFIVKIDRVPIFTKDYVVASFSRLRDQGSVSFSMTFAPERKSSAKHLCTSANEYCLLAPATKWSDDIPTSEINTIKSKFAPAEDDMNEHMPTLSIISLRAIAAAQNPDLESMPTEIIQIMINAIRSKAVLQLNKLSAILLAES